MEPCFDFFSSTFNAAFACIKSTNLMLCEIVLAPFNARDIYP